MVLKYQLPFSNPDVKDGFGSTLPPRTIPHRGLDFAQPVGAPIPAVAAGVIADKGQSAELGHYTVVGHPDGMYTGYCHSNQASSLATGAAVSRGSIINVVGDLGFTTGPHLHLTLSTSSQGVHTGPVQDPLPYINARLNGDDPGTTPQPEPGFDFAKGANVALVMNRTLDNVIAVFDETHWQEFSYTSSMTPSPGVPQFVLDFVAGIAHSLPTVPYDVLGWEGRSNKMPGLKRPLYNVDSVAQTITPIIP